MKALVQRVSQSSVLVDHEETGSTGTGLVVFLGVGRDDDESDAAYLVEKIANLRIFPDEQDRFDRSALDVGAELLLVSQFTLYADTRRGRRPDFTRAAPPEEARRLYDHAVELFRRIGLRVGVGMFQEHMSVRLENDGPVTLLLDSADRHLPRRG